MSGSSKRFTLAELAHHVGGDVRGAGDPVITGLNSLGDAVTGDLTFITNPKYVSHWSASKASAALFSKSLSPQFPIEDSRPLIVVDDAEQSMIRLLEVFQVEDQLPDIGIHPTAFIHADASIGKNVRVGPHVSIDRGSVLGDGVVLFSGARVYANVTIGAGTILHANVVVRERSKIGRGAILHQNVSIGADGFGYRPSPDGNGLVKIPHIGNVLIEDGVEIGANTCIDRGKFGSTIIGAGTKIDNLCQIAHNCKIGRCCVIAGQSGMAGSVVVGDGVQIGGQVGITDHHRIGSGVKIGAGSLVLKDIPAGATWLGRPAENAQNVLRQWAALRKLPELLRNLKG